MTDFVLAVVASSDFIPGFPSDLLNVHTNGSALILRDSAISLILQFSWQSHNYNVINLSHLPESMLAWMFCQKFHLLSFCLVPKRKAKISFFAFVFFYKSLLRRDLIRNPRSSSFEEEEEEIKIPKSWSQQLLIWSHSCVLHITHPYIIWRFSCCFTKLHCEDIW